MYNLLVVEDEEMIRNKILLCCDWTANGFNHVYEADNGATALEIVANKDIDIVVTDIQMPKMNGIELIREIRAFDKTIKIVVISGHAEFEYAKESLTLNVKDYILKPFLSKNLLEILLKLKEELIRQQSEQEELESMKRQLKENRLLLQEKLFADLLNNCFIGNLDKNLQYLSLDHMYNHTFFVAVLNIEGFAEILNDSDEEQKYIYNLSFYNWANKFLLAYKNANNLFEQFAYDYYLLNYRLDQLVLISFQSQDIVLQILECMVEQARKEVGLQITIGVGNPYANLKDLHISLHEASAAVTLSSLHGKGIVFTFNGICFDNQEYSKHLTNIVDNKIYNNIKVGAFEEIKKEIVNIVSQIKSSMLGVKAIETIVRNMILLSCKAINEMGYDMHDIFGADGAPDFNMNEINSQVQLEEWLFTFFVKVNDYVISKRSNRNQQLIMQVKDYASQHYAEGINLSYFAKKYNISTGYLSVLFNEQFGQNFIDYLTNLRIQKAKELLKNSDLRVYEIAEKIGYRDAYYFSAAFKKVVGVNPTEYRESLTELHM